MQLLFEFIIIFKKKTPKHCILITEARMIILKDDLDYIIPLLKTLQHYLIEIEKRHEN